MCRGGCRHLLPRLALMRVSRASAETHLTVMNQSYHRNIDMQLMAHSPEKKGPGMEKPRDILHLSSFSRLRGNLSLACGNTMWLAQDQLLELF